MAKLLAVAGKGGTGKTTISALIVRQLIKHSIEPVLAIDADPNSNLGETLGLEIGVTIGDIREELMKHPDMVPAGMDKASYFELKMNQLVIENPAFDLVVMGRQEGAGCYCMINNILRRVSDEMAKNYKVMVVDNEAGMEHLSRRTAHKIDMLWLVTDHALRGLRAVRRIKELIGSLNLDVKDAAIIANRAPETLAPAFLKEVEEIGLPLIGTVPPDPNLETYDMEGKSLIDLPEDSPSVVAVEGLFQKTFK